MSKKGKTRAIIAHLTIIGWAVAWIVNKDDKDEFADFYLRQTLGIYLMITIGWFLPLIYTIVSVLVLILWGISLYGAITDRKAQVPLIGQYFQDWFKLL